MRFQYGKNVKIDPDHPTGLGICDYSGLVFNRKDMVKQMEWRGNRLVWTGFIVGKSWVDMPQEQFRPPQLKPDPVPLKDPRPPQTLFFYWSNIQSPVWGQLEIVNWSFWGSYITTTQVDLIGNNTNLEFQPAWPDGVPALPEDERRAALDDIWWGG
jgi:hypothetical protein